MRRPRLVPAFHIERSIANRSRLPEYLCACSTCKGGRIRKVETIAKHHRLYGRDRSLPHPILTVDGRNLRGPVQQTDRGEEFYHRERRNGGSPDFAWPNMEGVDYQGMMYTAFEYADTLHADAAVDGRNFEPEPDLEEAEIDEVDYENLIKDSIDPVYTGCHENKIQCGIVLMS
ncbi:hypothetical protein KC19_VG337500 [Ceratodon purpureus]|uniref:Uncharacterized protein n=1 Tax=Ceratodon purpureus TaxID=3225 RepID=A0A8T0HXD3_CERPU|nr:hypothetical protein KC19_VG337500 [Ceratodon purpureus]